MQPPHLHSRVNLAELRAQIFKKLGPERSKQYFYYLNRLLSLKVSKVEFDQLCFRVLGRENVSLHNQFIRSIWKNACHAKTPPSPPTSHKEVSKCTNDGYHVSGPFPLSNGNALPLSPQKVRLGVAIGPTGKVDFASHNSTVTSDSVILENGDLYSPNVQNPVQHHQMLSEKTDYEGKVLLHQPDKLALIKGSTDGVVSVNSRYYSKVLLAENEKGVSTRNVLEAPLGIPFCSVSVDGARKALPSARSDRFANSIDSGELLDTGTLRERMQHIAIAEDLEGVSMDCANLLNNGLDSYLKGLIRSCIDLVGARSRRDLMNSTHKHQSHGKLVNGVLPGHHYQVQRASEGVEDQRPNCPISLLDFKVAMELNPRQLGEDWPLLLERICTHAFEE